MKVNKHIIDPRVKILGVAILTGFIVFEHRMLQQVLIGMMSLGFAIYVEADLIRILKKLKRFLTLFFSLIVIQSLFRSGGNPLISIFGIRIITDQGLYMAISYVIRMFVIITSGAVISTSSMRTTLQGLSQLRLPYVLGLMTSIGLRFLPILGEEIQNAYISMSLRGINVAALPIKQRINIIGRLFVPIVFSSLHRAQNISESIEMRGYVIGGKRSSYYTLKMSFKDYIILLVLIVLVLTTVFL
jgi:energy-coupling factor transport system permease protein